MLTVVAFNLLLGRERRNFQYLDTFFMHFSRVSSDQGEC